MHKDNFGKNAVSIFTYNRRQIFLASASGLIRDLCPGFTLLARIYAQNAQFDCIHNAYVHFVEKCD